MELSIRHLRWIANIKELFSLAEDTDEESAIQSIKNNVEFRRGNAWTLVFAVFIASIGLNTNSAAVIIGAMLISPLMGPIVGAGLALGTYDIGLLRHSLKHLGVAVAISLVTATLYFLLSPISDAQTEILARTRPTVLDVLIATFGGAAGIVAATRRERGNAIPGVAIATALMPPLCTAGYGLASGQWGYFLGALYLFCINCVFICLSTYLFVRILKFPVAPGLDEVKREKIRNASTWVAVLTILPSVALAWYFVQEARFAKQAAVFVKTELTQAGIHVVQTTPTFRFRSRTLEVMTLGSEIPAEQQQTLRERLARYQLEGTELILTQSSLEQTLERRLSARLKAQAVAASEMDYLRGELDRLRSLGPLSRQIQDEVKILFPTLQELQLSTVFSPEERVVALVSWEKTPSTQIRQQLARLLQTRLTDSELMIFQVEQVVPTQRKRK